MNRIEVRDVNIILFENGRERKLSVSDVLMEFGTRAMLSLDRGDRFFWISESKEDAKNDRPGS